MIFSACGEYLTKESLAAMQIIRRHFPIVKMRFVSLLELSAVGIGNAACRVPAHPLEYYYTDSKPVIFNFHGYPETLKQKLFDWKTNHNRLSVHGYVENGSTTTPFDLQTRNNTSRWDLVIEALETLAIEKVIGKKEAHQLADHYRAKIDEHKEYVRKNGVDLPEIENWTWQSS